MKNLVNMSWKKYLDLLNRKPLVAHAISTTSRFSKGPALSKWIRVINSFSGTTTVKVVKMLLADQLLFTPPILLGVVSSLGLLRGQSIPQLKQHLSDRYWTILFMNYKIWPLAQSINFFFIPLQFRYVSVTLNPFFRVLYINFVALFWNVYVAYVTQSLSKIPLITEVPITD
ncbi:protein Mpv17 [Paragonimus westermani]|uniref:Mitochondrial inner membrane protein Mpv17 n=1 Tax=Paragonimus westermani TaxID=34504 RepID=A0A5J4NDC2_9TREM|nr:protein Mpv17 [Paragonimus westermani]